MVECLPTKHEVLNSNPSTTKTKQNKNLPSISLWLLKHIAHASLRAMEWEADVRQCTIENEDIGEFFFVFFFF
jgi:hypothetical protein